MSTQSLRRESRLTDSDFVPPEIVPAETANNLFMEDHLIYAMVLILLAAVGAGRTLGLGRAWESASIVKRHGWLR